MSSTTAIKTQTVLVCGSLHLDVVVSAPDLPRPDETVAGQEVHYVCGGKGGNQAVAASLNGASTAFIGCIGDDEFGNKLLQHLQQNRVDCSALQKVRGASGMSVAIVDNRGDYGAVIVSASNLQIDHSALSVPPSTGIVLLQNEIPDNTNIAIAQQARAQNIPVMLNAAPFRNIPTALEPLIDILVLNRIEAEQYFKRPFANADEVASALTRTRSPIHTLIVTLGEDGLVYRDKSARVDTKSACSVVVHSTHGAGDMFCGALASQLITANSLSTALDYAMAAAACHVSATPDQRSHIDSANVNAMLVQLNQRQ